MKKLLILLLLMMCTGCASKADSQYYAIDHFYFREEGDAFVTAFNKTTVDMYNWYKSIEGEDGVYILHSDHYDDALLEEWRSYHVFDNIPEKGFRYFAVSENYLRDRGYVLTEADSEKVRSGVRLYLLPDSMPEEERTIMEAFLREDALHGLSGDPMIPTVFEAEHAIEFRTYHFEGTLETENEGGIKDPVIYVCSSANMRYFESESLTATGKTDSYIKLTKEAYERFVKNSLPEELKERQITFLPLGRIRN